MSTHEQREAALSGAEREAMGGAMDDRYGLRVQDARYEEEYEAGWKAARAFYAPSADESALSHPPESSEGEREVTEVEVERLIDKMLDYHLLADPEDSERNRVIACDLIRWWRRHREPLRYPHADRDAPKRRS